MFKLVSLRASGFKRLDLQEKLEFPDGRLLVHGRNESGKSTLMEAIHYALYGNPLRPSKNAGNEDIICYGRNDAVVELEFSIDDTQYQIRRELKRNKTNVHILNKREQDGTLSRVTTGARNVNSEISVILHGIDSDALLNSCLVEQKELGKLEDVSKQERIKAMSSLLNLEAFIGSKEKLKKNCSDLEKTHSNTLMELQKAEQAKEEYEQAEKIRKAAEKRLAEIETEKIQVKETLERLRRELETIQQMKIHQTKINEGTMQRRSKENELKQLKERIAEIEKAEQELYEIEKKLPEAEKNLIELDRKLETVQLLSDLHEKLNRLESSIEIINVKHEEAQRAYTEAIEAEETITELDHKIKEYAPVKAASEKLNEISNHFNQLATSRNETARLEEELKSAKDKLEDSKTSADKIKALENEEADTKNIKSKALITRRNGSIVAVSGILLAFILANFINLASATLGIIILAVGGYLYISNDTGRMDAALDSIRARREDLLGERARIQDYHETIKQLESELRETVETHSRTEETLVQTLNQLPDTPREYKTTVGLTDPETLNTLRSQIQEDAETLTRYTTEKESLKKKADSIETAKQTLGSTAKDKKTREIEAENLGKQVSETEQTTGITASQEAEIRKQHTEANKTQTQLTTQRTECLRGLELRPQIQEQINETGNEINLISATLKQEENKLKELEKQGVNLGDEPLLSEERDSNLRQSASLEKEEQERDSDVEESKQVMDRTGGLKEEYPTLLDESEKEQFNVEAMRRATILLDTTRDNIMSGVKQNVEKNMMQFLPTLTDNRYNMARIDETNYRIEVYDREAKQWRGKGVFSGATQDQFSLALRLAFAISTIPSSRGARPGFIFLDEPLSGFDAQRRSGFMQLLREDLSRHFDQIIVISHIEALAEEFQNTLTLDSGRVIQVQR